MKTIKIIAFTVLFSAISGNVYCALYTVTNNGTEAVTVNLDIVSKAGFGTIRHEKPLTVGLNPGDSTKLNAYGGKYCYSISLTKSGEKNLLPLNVKSIGSGGTLKDNILFPKFSPTNADFTIILTNKKSSWTIETHRSK